VDEDDNLWKDIGGSFIGDSVASKPNNNITSSPPPVLNSSEIDFVPTKESNNGEESSTKKVPISEDYVPTTR
jgi:hypothetical protein